MDISSSGNTKKFIHRVQVTTRERETHTHRMALPYVRDACSAPLSSSSSSSSPSPSSSLIRLLADQKRKKKKRFLESSVIVKPRPHRSLFASSTYCCRTSSITSCPSTNSPTTAAAPATQRVDNEAAAFTSSSSSRRLSSVSNLAVLALLAATSASEAAQAATAEDITNVVLKVQDVTEKITGAVGSAYGTSKEFIEQLFTTVKPAVDAAAPYVQKATEAAVQVAAPIASDVATQAEKALKNAGLDAKPVVDAAKTAVVVAGEAAEQTSKVIEGAKPVATSTFESLVSADPLLIAVGAGTLLLLYLAAPSILSSLAYAARGYQGDLTAAQVLDYLSKVDYTLIDVRTDKEKAKSGIPSLPRNAKNKYIAIPLEEVPGKLRGQLRNPKKVEAEVAALKISYLKRIGKGSNVIILDSYGDVAKMVAKALSSLGGLKRAWVAKDGFDGATGWTQSRLGTDSFASSSFGIAEVLSPSRIIPAAGTKKLFNTTSSSSEVVDVITPKFNRLQLPGGE